MCKKIMKGLIKMIRGITYNKQLFKSNDFALMTKRFFNNSDGKINGCDLSTSGNNIIIDKGWFIASGYYNNISSQEIIEVSRSGILVYEIDLSKINTMQNFNQGSFKIIIGTPTQDDLFDEGTIYQMPIAQISTDGTNASITEILWQDIQEDYQTQINNCVKKNNVVTMAGNVSINNDYYGTNEINYPSGFNKDNCIVLSKQISYMGTNYTTGIEFGNWQSYVTMKSDKIIFGIQSLSTSTKVTKTIPYKLTLMKLS